MKITITFTETEKQALLNSTDASDLEDKAMKETGKFGSFIYSKKNNKIDMDLTETYIISSACLFGRIARVVKDIIKLTESFCNEWFDESELEVEEFDEDEEVNSTSEDLNA